ncbi:MAG: FecCD family ABC transporter permease [Parvibaculaceae bacterium]
MSGRLPYGILLLGLGGLAGLLFLASLLVGVASVPWRISVEALFASDTSPMSILMQEIRLPRALLGLLVGGILALSGAVLQGLLRNPLAEPGVIGVSASASLGAVIAFYTGLSALLPYALPAMAIGGALLAVLLMLALAGRAGDVLTLILAGVAISTLAGALTSLVLNLSPNPFGAIEIVFWMMGSLTDRSMAHLWLAAPFILAGAALLFLTGRALDALTLGEDVAASVGVDLSRTRILAALGTALGVGAATAVTGAIGFVGLVVPHLLRPLVGSAPSRLLPASALGGAALLTAADLMVRLVLPGKDLKLGVVTALVGVPFFLWLLVKVRRSIA